MKSFFKLLMIKLEEFQEKNLIKFKNTNLIKIARLT